MGPNLVIHIVGAKSDLEQERQVDPDEARRWVDQWVREDEGSDLSDQPPDAPALGSPSSPSATSTTSAPPYASPTTTPTGLPKSTSTRIGLVSQLSFGSSSRKAAEEQQQQQQQQEACKREPWCSFQISEVSAKADRGIEEVFRDGMPVPLECSALLGCWTDTLDVCVSSDGTSSGA